MSEETVNVQMLMGMGDKTPVLAPVQGILFHGASKSGGDFWALKDNNKNTIYVKFWNCNMPQIPEGTEQVVTFYPELSTGKEGSTNSNIKVTVYNGKAGLNVNKGYRIDMDGGSPPPPDSRPQTEGNEKLAYSVDISAKTNDSAASKTLQIALYRLLCDNTVQGTHGDKGYTPELLKDISTSIFIQGTRQGLHEQISIPTQPAESDDVPF